MPLRFIIRSLIACNVAVVFSLPLFAQQASSYAVRASAVAEDSTRSINLSWPDDPLASSYRAYRKLSNAASWQDSLGLLPPVALGLLDTNVTVGVAYEYWISKVGGVDGQGYVCAGIKTPLVESRGTVALIIDSTFTASLSNELARLEQDLAGDGWSVVRHAVPRMAVDPANTSPGVWAARSNELASVKALITADYVRNPDLVKAVFILGHVPVPYSGDIYPDQHANHRGAWPADAFYGDMDGVWPDAAVNRTSATDPRNRNVPGDGKFDRSTFPSDLELQVGRVDFANLPAFAAGEEDLLRRYLNKNHAFRHKMFKAEQRGLIDDHLGVRRANRLLPMVGEISLPFLEPPTAWPGIGSARWRRRATFGDTAAEAEVTLVVPV